jgi:2,3-dihydroxybiphenyl 1,2-dioxygenase
LLTSLAYLGFRSPRFDEWGSFGPDVLGLMRAADGDDGAVRLRIDDAEWRIQVHPGDQDDVAYLGWAVESERDLATYAARLADAGIEAVRGSDEVAAARSVDQLLWFEDPWGFRHELAWGQFVDPGSFRPGRPLTGFVTGDQGLGHAVLLLPDAQAGHDFFSGVMGFELSDKIARPGGGYSRFYHCNGRHHSLAIAEVPGSVGLNHIMLQVRDIDDVGTTYDTCLASGVPLRKHLGRHTNDQMISFYLTTPSSFHIEYGYGAVEVDETWVPATYRRPSTWGHKLTDEATATSPGIVRPHPQTAAV